MTKNINYIYYQKIQIAIITKTRLEITLLSNHKTADFIYYVAWNYITIISEKHKVRKMARSLSDVSDVSESSCTDQVNTLRIIVEQSNECQVPKIMLCVDFDRAFDSLDRRVMFEVLESSGIPPLFLRIIRSMFLGANCRGILHGELGRSSR